MIEIKASCISPGKDDVSASIECAIPIEQIGGEMRHHADKPNRAIRCFILPGSVEPLVTSFLGRHLEGECRMNSGPNRLLAVWLHHAADIALFRIFFCDDILREYGMVTIDQADSPPVWPRGIEIPGLSGWRPC